MLDIYDILIIGASMDGIKAYNKIKKYCTTSVAVVSSSFDNCNKKYTIKKIDRIDGIVVNLLYKRGLFIVSLSNKQTISCKYVIIATGSTYKKLNLNTTNIYYNINKIKTRSKLKPILVLGEKDLAIASAKELAKKYNYIYLCLKEDTLTYQEYFELNSIKNIVVLLNCNIKGCKKTKLDELFAVQTDTYNDIRCSYILACMTRSPDVNIKTNLGLDSTGAIAVKNTFETKAVPNVYAIGACSSAKAGINMKCINNINLKLRGNS